MVEEITDSGFQEHKECVVGDHVTAVTADGKEYAGTVQKRAGATVFVQSESGRMLEFRRIHDTSQQAKAIMLGIDGKDEIEDLRTEQGYNKDGLKVTRETTRISMDKWVVEFDATDQQITIG